SREGGRQGGTGRGAARFQIVEYGIVEDFPPIAARQAVHRLGGGPALGFAEILGDAYIRGLVGRRHRTARQQRQRNRRDPAAGDHARFPFPPAGFCTWTRSPLWIAS